MRSRQGSPHHRHDGSSPLPLGMDASPTPSKWEGVNTVWPHDPSTGWSYCATIHSWVVIPEAKTAQGTFINPTVYYRVLVGIQSPQGLTAVHPILRRFSDFLKLHAALKTTLKKKIPAAPPKNALLRMNSSHTLIQERRHVLDDWLSTLLQDIEISRSTPMAAFLELEAAARSAVNTFSNAQEESRSVVAGPPSSPPPLWTSSVFPGPDYASDAACSTSGVRTPATMSELGTEAETESTVETPAVHSKLKGKEIQNGTELHRTTSDATIESVHRSKDSDSDIASEPSVPVSADGPTDSSLILVAGIERRMAGLPNFEADFLKGVSVMLPADQRGNVKRVLTAVQRRFEIVKADMEDLITRLNQEVAVKEFLTTKVRDLESELDSTKRRAQDALQQAVSSERERVTELQWELEDCRADLVRAEESLQAERDGKSVEIQSLQTLEAEVEAFKEECRQLKEQVELLAKEKDAIETQARAEKRVLAKEIKALRKSTPELKEELEKTLQAKATLEETLKKKRDKEDVLKASRGSFIHEISAFRQRLRECSVDSLAKEDTVDTNAMDLLGTSDGRINLLLAEAELMVQQDEYGETGSPKHHPNGTTEMDSETSLKKLLVEVLIDNAKLRKNLNAATRSAFLSLELRDREALEEPVTMKRLLSKFLS